MDKINDNKIICHIIGLNQDSKENIKKMCERYKKYNLIDLDILYDEILNSEEMKKMFTSYSKLKKNKNDKFKEIDKKMTKFWEDNLILKVNNLIPSKRKSILIGKNHHYRILSKRVNFLVSNKFILDYDIKDEVKKSIKENLQKYHNDIVNGTFPINLLDYKHQINKRKLFEESYIKTGYAKIDLQEIINLLESHIKNKIKGKGLWYSSNQPFNVGSKIYPEKDKIYAFIDPILSLLDSFKFSSDEIDYSNSEDKVISLNTGNLNKMKKPKYLYFVAKDGFIPQETTKMHKYFTQSHAIVLEKEKISNVYEKLKELDILK